MEINQYSLILIGVGGTLLLYLSRKYFKGGRLGDLVSATGKIAIVTGANVGLGLETVRELNLRGAKVYMLCGSEEQAHEARSALIQKGCDDSRLISETCDFAKFASVRACVERIAKAESTIDILVNNAGGCFLKYQLTEDGHEKTFQCNHLGPFLLTELLLPLLEKADDGRIMNVSSVAYEISSPIDLETIDTESDYGSSFLVYARSKLANVMHARELTRRLRADSRTSVTVNSLPRGVGRSDMARQYGWFNMVYEHFLAFLMMAAKNEVDTILYLALSPAVKGVSGYYFSDCVPRVESPAALDDFACKQLYDYSLKTVGL